MEIPNKIYIERSTANILSHQDDTLASIWREEKEWLQGLFECALSVKSISEVKFHDKWNEASKIIKQIEKL